MRVECIVRLFERWFVVACGFSLRRGRGLWQYPCLGVLSADGFDPRCWFVGLEITVFLESHS